MLVRIKGILLVELRVGTRTSLKTFFVVETLAVYNALLGQDWTHPNFCIPSTFHQFLIFWNGKDIGVVVGVGNVPFVARVNHSDTFVYKNNVRIVNMFGVN